MASAKLELSPRSQNIPIQYTKDDTSIMLQSPLLRNSKENIVPNISLTNQASLEIERQSRLEDTSKSLKEFFVELPKLKQLQSPGKLYKNYSSRAASATLPKGAKAIATAYNKQLQQSQVKNQEARYTSEIPPTKSLAQPQTSIIFKANKPFIQSTSGTRASTLDEILPKTEVLLKAKESTDLQTLGLQTTLEEGDKQVRSSSLPSKPGARITETSPPKNLLLPTSKTEKLVLHNDVVIPRNDLTSQPKGGEAIDIDCGPLELVFLPEPKESNTSRRRRHLKKYLDKVSSFKGAQEYKLSAATVTDVQTPCQRFCSLLEQLYGPGDIRRGDGRKPNKVKNEAVRSGELVDTEFMAATSSPPPPSPMIRRLPRSALAFASVPLDPSDNGTQVSDSDPEINSHNNIVDIVAQPDDSGMVVDIPIPLAEQTPVVNENPYSNKDQEEFMEEGTMNNELAQDVKWHDPSDWKRDLRCLVAGKNVIDTAGLLNINSALNSLEEMLQASSGQSLVMSLISDLAEYLVQVKDLPDGYIPFNDSFNIRRRVDALLLLTLGSGGNDNQPLP